MKRTMVIASVVVMGLMLCSWTYDAWARAGGGKSSGSRGSRSSSAPAERMQQPAARRSRSTGGVASLRTTAQKLDEWADGGITGFLIGGAIGSLLLGGLGGGGLFGGIGLLEILLIGGVLYFAFTYMRRRQQPTPASPYGYGTPQGCHVLLVVNVAGKHDDDAGGVGRGG